MASSSVCWNNLPSVVLLELFKMMSHEERMLASTTCKEWRKAFFFPNFWRDLSIELHSKNDSYAIEKCQFLTSSFLPAVRNLKIVFAYENKYMIQVSRILCELSANRQMKKLFLYGTEVSPDENLVLSLYGCAVKLLYFLENVKSLDSLYISHIWFSLKNDKFKVVLEKQKESLLSLGIGGLVSGNQQSGVLPMPIDFSVFKSLNVLSLDHLWVTDESLKQICDLKLLKRLIIIVHKEFRGRRIKTESWENFQKSLPECDLRVNLIKGISKEVMGIFSKKMPVTHIKVLYCDEVDLSLMSVFSSFKDLKSVWCFAEEELALPPEQNPLVICAWTCTKLEELVISGFQFDYEDLVGISRLRGSKLKRLEVTQRDIVKLFIIDSMYHWQSRNLFPIEMKMFTEMMSKALDRNWSPVETSAYNHSGLSPDENKIKNIVDILTKDHEF